MYIILCDIFLRHLQFIIDLLTVPYRLHVIISYQIGSQKFPHTDLCPPGALQLKADKKINRDLQLEINGNNFLITRRRSVEFTREVFTRASPTRDYRRTNDVDIVRKFAMRVNFYGFIIDPGSVICVSSFLRFHHGLEPRSVVIRSSSIQQ